MGQLVVRCDDHSFADAVVLRTASAAKDLQHVEYP